MQPKQKYDQVAYPQNFPLVIGEQYMRLGLSGTQVELLLSIGSQSSCGYWMPRQLQYAAQAYQELRRL